MHRSQRLTASLDGEFVVFLIGMRVNRPLRIDKWLPVVTAMTRMIGELREQPHLGLLHAVDQRGRNPFASKRFASPFPLPLFPRPQG